MKLLVFFSHRWKIPALLMLAASIALFIANEYYKFEPSWLTTKSNANWSNNNLTDEIWLSGMIGSLLLLCFCREQLEDEYVQNIRLHAWRSAILVNYLLLLGAIWLEYGGAFFGALMYNVLTPLLIYLIIFYTRLHLIPRLGKRQTAL